MIHKIAFICCLRLWDSPLRSHVKSRFCNCWSYKNRRFLLRYFCRQYCCYQYLNGL